GDCRQSLADARRSGEEEAWRKGAVADGPLQQIDEPVMADHVTERHRTGMLSRATRRLSFSVAAARRAFPGLWTHRPGRSRTCATRSRASSAEAAVAAAPRRVRSRRWSPWAWARAWRRRPDRQPAAATAAPPRRRN